MKIIEKLLNSLVHRSGVLLEVRNLILKMKIDPNNDKLIKNCQTFRKLVVAMSVEVPLKMIGESNKDGSYPIYMYQDFKQIKVISIGVGNNIIFDMGIAKLGGTVWCFDHTVAPKLKKKYKNSIFYLPYGIMGKNPIPKCKTLREIIEMSDDSKIFNGAIFKMDCEGAEWDVLSSNSIKQLSTFDQIIVEFHNLEKFSDFNFAKMATGIFKKLQSEFFIAYIAPNNFTPIVKLADDTLWPFTLEVHFINKKLIMKNFLDMRQKQSLNALYKDKNHWHLGSRINLQSWYEAK